MLRLLNPELGISSLIILITDGQFLIPISGIMLLLPRLLRLVLQLQLQQVVHPVVQLLLHNQLRLLPVRQQLQHCSGIIKIWL